MRKLLNLLLAMVMLSFLAATPAAAQKAPAAAPAPAPRAATAPSTSTSTATVEGYQIGPEDVIEVDVLGQQDFRTRVKVKADGTVPLPYIGTLKVTGYTPTSLASEVSGRLKAGGYYANPVVNVEVVSYASRYVIVLGEVVSAGLVPVDRGYRVSEILARVGGIRQTGAPYVVLTREGQSEIKLPFTNLARGTETDDPLVQPGDKLFVPQAEKFFIYGAINAPGEYSLDDKMSLRKALARAGGVSPNGSEKRVKIFHDGAETKKPDLERIVQSGDVIVVGERLF